MLNGARGMSNNKNRVIDDPSDLNGLKIRVMENDIYLETFETLGAAPTAMSLAEVFTGLQQGTIDGQDNPPGITCSNKFYEVQTNYSTLNHCIDMVPVLVSEEWYRECFFYSQYSRGRTRNARFSSDGIATIHSVAID